MLDKVSLILVIAALISLAAGYMSVKISRIDQDFSSNRQAVNSFLLAFFLLAVVGAVMFRT